MCQTRALRVFWVQWQPYFSLWLNKLPFWFCTRMRWAYPWRQVRPWCVDETRHMNLSSWQPDLRPWWLHHAYLGAQPCPSRLSSRDALLTAGTLHCPPSWSLPSPRESLSLSRQGHSRPPRPTQHHCSSPAHSLHSLGFLIWQIVVITIVVVLIIMMVVIITITNSVHEIM